MTERPYHVSVDLGQAAYGALEEMVEESGMNRSEVIRVVIEMGHLLGLVHKWEELSQHLSQQVIPGLGKYAQPELVKAQKPMTDYERDVVQVWRETFDTDKNIFVPAALAAIRGAISGGLSYVDVMECIKAAPEDDVVKSHILNGRIPQLHEILSTKMLGRLVPLAQARRSRLVTTEKMALEASVKPSAIQHLREAGVGKEQFAVAWAMIQKAQSRQEVEEITQAAIDNTIEELIGEASE